MIRYLTTIAVLSASIAWTALSAPLEAAPPVGVVPLTADDLGMQRHKIRDMGQMRASYINIENSGVRGFYLQDPFALQELISRYITITGDRSILDERMADTTCYEWLKRWGNKLHDEFGKGPGGLIDVGDDGSYIGMPFRIARRLYEHGNPQTGWEIMKRMARLADHFCLMPQSPQAEESYGHSVTVSGLKSIQTDEGKE